MARDRLFEEFSPTAYAEWRNEAEQLLKGASIEKRLISPTWEEIEIEPIYARENCPDEVDWDSLPGRPPFTRGFAVERIEQAPWLIACEAGADDPKIDRDLVELDLKRGSTALIYHVDCSSSSSLTAAEVDAILEAVDLKKIPVFFECKSSGNACLQLYLEAARNQGAKIEELAGAVAFDPLGGLVQQGWIPGSLETACAEMAEMSIRASKHAPLIGTAWIHGEVYHNGGGSAVHELAFTMATALFYLRALEDRRVTLETALPLFRFSTALGSDFFMEVAKLRAARQLWNRLLESCGVAEEQRSLWMHGSTSAYTSTLTDPHVNLLRATTQALSGVVGGVDSLYVAPYDRLFQSPDAFSRRLTRNLQLMISEEAHLREVVDPSGGSWYVERLTRELAARAWSLFKEVEKRGGMDRAVADGFPQAEVAETARRRDEAVACRQQRIVGTNQYPNAGETVSVENEQARTGPAESTDRKGATAEAIPERRASRPFEHLRRIVQAHRSDRGGMAVALTCLNSAGRYRSQLDFAASSLVAGGFKVVQPDESTQQAADRDTAATVICGFDAMNADDHLVRIKKMKRIDPALVVGLVFKPPDQAMERTLNEAGVDFFLHQAVNLLETMTDLARRLGVTL